MSQLGSCPLGSQETARAPGLELAFAPAVETGGCMDTKSAFADSPREVPAAARRAVATLRERDLVAVMRLRPSLHSTGKQAIPFRLTMPFNGTLTIAIYRVTGGLGSRKVHTRCEGRFG
jgi:hypothetical protein